MNVLLCAVLLAGPRAYEGRRAVEAPDAPMSEPRTEPAPHVDAAPTDDDRIPPAVRPNPPAQARTWTVGAFVDAAYVVNSNGPDNHVNRGIITAPRTGELTIPIGAAYLRHDPSAREPWQLELALQIGPSTAALVASSPQPSGDGGRFAGPSVWQHVGRASAGGRIPRLRTEISAGLFGTPIGYWSFWPKDNWTYSTPWHLNAVPYSLLGARVLQPVGDRVVLHAWLVNGWQSFADLNRVPSYMFGVVATPVPGLQLGLFEYFGPESVDTSARAWRWLSDAWAVLERERWGLAVVADVVRERITARTGEPVALYVTGAVTPRVRLFQTRSQRLRWYLSARGEAFWDRDGLVTGVRQLLGSAALGTDLGLFDYLLVRVEYRYDHSDASRGYFYRGAAVHDGDRLARQQHAVYLSLTGMFAHWFRVRGPR